MLTIEEIIYLLLKNNIPISNLIQDKIYPLMAAQNKNVPFITYTVEVQPNSNKKEKSLYDSYRIELDIFTDKYSDIVNLSKDVRNNFEALIFTQNNIKVYFDYILTKEDYKNDAGLYNRTVVLLADYIIN